MRLIKYYHEYDLLEFGRFRGKKIGDIIQAYPMYMRWCVENVYRCTLGNWLLKSLMYRLRDAGYEWDFEKRKTPQLIKLN